MKSLKELVQDPAVFRSLVEDSLRTLDGEVSKRSGIGGLALKGAYKVLKGVQQGKVLRKGVEKLMPDFVEQLDPYFTRYRQQGKGISWSEYLKPHHEAIADQLLRVTDARVQESSSQTVHTTYQKFRPKARKEVVTSLPALARMMEPYLPKA
ncbi:MAG: hypothetical protein AB1640_18130 [bacterium]